MSLDNVKQLDEGYRAAMRNLARERAEKEAWYSARLKDLSTEELLYLAEQCGAEIGPEHCYRCEAWYMYIERTEND